MIIGRKTAVLINVKRLHLVRNYDDCSHCKLCDKNCPMDLPVNEMVATNNLEKSDCILCGTGVDSCHKNVIEFSFD